MKNIFTLFVGVFTLNGIYSQYAMVTIGRNSTKIVALFYFNIRQISYTTFHNLAKEFDSYTNSV
jgi:hypothetical protein